MTGNGGPVCLLCGKPWVFARYEGRVYVIPRHQPDCTLADPTLLPEPGPQGDAA
jgi:hypothetical protein